MSGRPGAVTLHEEIAEILAGHGGGWMTTSELAAEVNRRGHYRKRDGSPVDDFQIHGRTRNYAHLFERDGSRVRLLTGLAPSAAVAPPPIRTTLRQAPSKPPAAGSARGSSEAIDDALRSLEQERAVPVTAASSLPDRPGLYAVHAAPATWAELGVGPPPDARPLYVGKSESSLQGRDIRTHFADGSTGSSTLRRSFAALLHDSLGVHGMPRNPDVPGYFSNYGLSPADDASLTAWMARHLALATWVAPADIMLAEVEKAVYTRLLPPLNLKGVLTPWSGLVSDKRRVMAREAEAWRP